MPKSGMPSDTGVPSGPCNGITIGENLVDLIMVTLQKCIVLLGPGIIGPSDML